MASKAAASKAKMNTKEESISQEKFFNYITIISKAIQVIETEYSGTKYNGLIYTIQKNVRANISEEGDFLKVFIDDKKVNISPIQETKGASKQLDNYVKKNDKVSITNRWCKMNKVNKVGKPPNFISWPHNINSILFVIFNKGILNIDWDEEMTYVNISIDKDMDVKKAIFTTNQSFSSKKDSMNMNNLIDGLDDDDDDGDD